MSRHEAGVACRIVAPDRSIAATQTVAVRDVLPPAIATVPPTNNGAKSSSAAMSKAIVVIASSVSERPMPGRWAMLESRLTRERWLTSTPFGAPVEPEV